MKYGCIGEHLKHSFSKEIHSHIADYDYDLREIPPYELDAFMTNADFKAINVTIPYKERVIPYLSYIDEGAKLIGAVNTIVKKDGKLYGYNTDFYGMSELARHVGISFKDKKVLILGTGGTSKTASAVALANGAREIVKASRASKNDTVLYTDVYKYHTDSEVIINTTPVGMYPNSYDKPIDISTFNKLEGVIDAIYNPQITPLILDARKRGIKAEGGLYMLVAQGVLASEYFMDTKYPSGLLDKVYQKIRKEKLNIALIGMPSSGKSTVGKILSERLGRSFSDTDTKIIEMAGESIPEIFKNRGEIAFRDIESLAIKDACKESAAVIATGGGVILREENVDALRENSRIYFIDRPLDMLIPTSDRPTASSRTDIEKRYNERYELYRAAADVIIDAAEDANAVADKILNDFLNFD